MTTTELIVSDDVMYCVKKKEKPFKYSSYHVRGKSRYKRFVQKLQERGYMFTSAWGTGDE